MFLSDSIRNLVNSIRASRRDRKGFVDGLRQNNLAMKEENDRYMKTLHESNNARKQELWAFLAQAKEQREMNAKETKASIKQSLDNVHQAVESIKQSTNEFSREMREDIALSRKYWSMLYGEEPLPDPNAPAPVSEDAKKTVDNNPQAKALEAQDISKETASPVDEQKPVEKNATSPKDLASESLQPIPKSSAKNSPSPKVKELVRKKKKPVDSSLDTPPSSPSKEKTSKKNKLLEPLDGGMCTGCNAYLAQNDKSCLNCGKRVSKKRA